MRKDAKYFTTQGQRFGKLTVISEIYLIRNGRKTRFAKCLCDCGKTTTQRIVDIFTTVSSCGCNRGKNKGVRGHGYTHDPIYSTFIGMKSRCYYKKDLRYNDYGGRGITIYEEWRKHPNLFFKWAYQNGYQKGLTIERKDNNGNYCPENCEFTSRGRQANNKRNNTVIDFNDEKMSMADFCRKHNLIYQRFHDRVYRFKWPIKKAILNCNKS